VVYLATSRSQRRFLPLVGREQEYERRTQSPVSHHDTLVAPARDTRDAEQPLVLGRYRLLERLGAGGFGVVWRARDELLHREVALKRIALPTAEDRDRATREALAGARLAHPAIVALYEAGADDGAFYLISELVHGGTLAAAIAVDELPDEELLEIGIALCDALAHAHARGVVHRDVKPQNILLPVPQGPAAAKLTDFGGAQLVGEEALTRTGDVLGTFAYMAPEQSEGRGAGAEADLYSLALVLYEGLSGVNPVRGPTPAATVRRIGRPLPALERLRGDLPRSLTRALDAALHPVPQERGTLGELHDALHETLAHGLRRSARRRRRRAEAAAEAPAGAARIAHYDSGARVSGTEPAALDPGSPESHSVPEHLPDTAGWLTLQRLLWLLGALALCVWQVSERRPGVALLAVAAALPPVLLVRRPGARWLAAALAPVLGLVGLAGAFPAVAGQAPRWRTRALLGALGYWWLVLGGPLLDEPGRRLWLELPAGALAAGGTGGHRYRVAWEGSLTGAANHALLPLLGLGVLLGAILWAAAAAVLPRLVRGAGVVPDTLAAIVWAVVLAGAAPLLDAGLLGPAALGHAGGSSPRGVILGASLGAVFAVGACALRGRADSYDH
jgi:eukaryotic-like serine/threonine-protein kinase